MDVSPADPSGQEDTTEEETSDAADSDASEISIPDSVPLGDTSIPTTLSETVENDSRAPSQADESDGPSQDQPTGGPIYNITQTSTEMNGTEKAVTVIDVDQDTTPDIALIDRDGDGNSDPTEEQFSDLYPNLEWEVWRSAVA